MATPSSPFSFLGDIFNRIGERLQPPDWAVHEIQHRAVLFLNHVLDTKQVFSNFTYTYYQQPINAMTPESLTKLGLIPPNLKTTIIREPQFNNGLVQGPLSDKGEVLWENAWAAVKSA